MNDEKLLQKLNWFYSLEMQQVDMYRTQSLKVSDTYLKKALGKFADIEQTHVENVAKLIEEFGGTPTVAGEFAAEISGWVTGNLSFFAGVENLLKFNISMEQKAMQDYRELLAKVEEKDVSAILWNNLLDEDLHTAWMFRKLEEIEGKNS